MTRYSLHLIAAGLLLTHAEGAIVIASQDHSVRRGPTIEGGLHIKQSTNDSTDRIGMFRFDSGLLGSDVTGATFLLTANSDTAIQFQGTFDYRLWGIIDGNATDELFIEGSGNYTPGSIYDGSVNLINEAQLTQLGDALGINAGDTISISTAELTAFLQADTNGTASFVVERLTLGGNSTFLDRTTGSPPRLDITVVPEPGTAILLASGMVGMTFRRRRD